jgi:hypothetical protein
MRVLIDAVAVDPGDFVRAFAQYHSAESIAIERQKPELGESATR